MKQGKAAGGYFLFIIREGLFRLRELWGWRGLVVIVIGFTMVLDSYSKSGASGTYMQGVGMLWLVLLFPPRMGKLLYLLPFSKKERKQYLGTYIAIYWVFLLMVIMAIGAVATLVSGNSYLFWLWETIIFTGPFMLAYSGVMLSSMATKDGQQTFSRVFITKNQYYEQNTISDVKAELQGETEAKKTVKKAKKKEEIIKNIFLYVSIFFIAIHCFFSEVVWFVFGKDALVIVTSMLIAYLGAIVIAIISLSEMAKELNPKECVGKEECACNS